MMPSISLPGVIAQSAHSAYHVGNQFILFLWIAADKSAFWPSHAAPWTAARMAMLRCTSESGRRPCAMAFPEMLPAFPFEELSASIENMFTTFRHRLAGA
jgi:hypothetical protein